MSKQARNDLPTVDEYLSRLFYQDANVEEDIACIAASIDHVVGDQGFGDTDPGLVGAIIIAMKAYESSSFLCVEVARLRESLNENTAALVSIAESIKQAKV